MIRCMGIYRDGVRDPHKDRVIDVSSPSEATAELHGLIEQAKGTSAYVWINLTDPTHQEMSVVSEAFGLDALHVEDSSSEQQRAKLEYAHDHIFALLKTLEWIDDSSDVETGQVACFVGDVFAISVRTGNNQDPDVARRRLDENPAIGAAGPVAVLWAIADVAADQYLQVGDDIQSDVEEIEQQVFSARPADAATRIYRLNRENIEMRRAVRPLAVVAMRLARGDHIGLPKSVIPYFRDIGDHILRANDMVDGFDSTLMTMLMAATARQDLRQNSDMRKISAWAAIIAVPTAIAGIYGMNFDNMPELHWTYGYPAVLALMGTICLLLYRGFKKSGWL